MDKEGIISNFKKFIDTFKIFKDYTFLIEENQSIIQQFFDQINNNYKIPYLNYNDELTELYNNLNILLTSIEEEPESVSDNFYEFINKEIGSESTDKIGFLKQYFRKPFEIVVENAKTPKTVLDNKDIEHNQNLIGFINQIERYFKFFSNKISGLKIFNNISKIEGNTVLIGANGSGKSTFARQLKKLHNKNITIISAQHLLYYNKSSSVNVSDEPFKNVRQYQASDKLANDTSNKNFTSEVIEDFDMLISALINEYVKKSTQYYKTDEKTESVLDKAISLWNSIIEHRSLDIIDSEIHAIDKYNKEEYDFNRMSDGEKAIFYYISHVLIADSNNYIVIDEPENHINLALCNLLWDKLEKVREDCTFIYLTHNVDFAVSRINAELLWNKGFTTPDNWIIEKIPKDSDMPEELLVEIAGSRKNILFCEGQKSSEDYKLYSILFGEQFTILPVGGHLNVINYVKIYNNLSIFKSKAIGCNC